MSDQTFLNDFWDDDGAAAYLGMKARTLKDWRDRRVGPAVTYIGGKPFYRKESLKKWLLSLEGKPLGYSRQPRRRGTAA